MRICSRRLVLTFFVSAALASQTSFIPPLILPDCTHDPCESTKYDEAAPSPLLCPEGIGQLPGSFFDSLGPWQKRYGRDSLQLSQRFLDEYLRAGLLPDLEHALTRCPAAVLEIMLNSLLAVDTREGWAASQTFLREILDLRDRVLGEPQVRQLMLEWNADVAYVYPKLLGLERLGPNSTLPEGRAQEGTREDPRAAPAGGNVEKKGWCLGQRFYVYDIPEPTLYGPGTLYCVQGQWGTEVLVHQYFKHNCNTLDPEKADWFYVPMYATCRYVSLGSNSTDPQEVVEDLDSLSNQHIWQPLLAFLRDSVYYHRNQGRDHIFLFADGQGPRIWDSYDLLRSESVFLSPEAMCPTWGEPLRRHVDIKPCLSSWKDIVIPGHTDYARIQYMKRHNKNSMDRRLLMTFHGRAPGLHDDYRDCEVRGQLMKLGQLYGLERGVDVGGFVGDYLERKGDSHFCLVPAGTSPWTNHLYESFHSGCIPVILSDDYVVAFQAELPWERFSIHWPESLVCSDTRCSDSPLYRHLDEMVGSPERIWEMKRELELHSCYFNWYSTDQACSPYLLIQQRLRGLLDHSSARKRFWGVPAALSERLPFLHLERRTRFKNFDNETSTFSWLHP